MTNSTATCAAPAADASRAGVANRIRIARRRVGLSQAALAARIGVRRAAVTQWEHPEKTLPSTTNLLQVAVETGVAWDWLATGRGPVSLEPSDDKRAGIHADHVAVSQEEQRVLAAFRRANPRQRDAFTRMLAAVV